MRPVDIDADGNGIWYDPTASPPLYNCGEPLLYDEAKDALIAAQATVERLSRYVEEIESGFEEPYNDGGPETSASYRSAMTDAGRGELLR